MTGEIVAIAGFALSLTTFLVGVVLSYRSSVVKRYAAERDFGHLKNSFSQMSQNLQSIQDEIEELKLSQMGLKNLIEVMLNLKNRE